MMAAESFALSRVNPLFIFPEVETTAATSEPVKAPSSRFIADY
jgi:hypothetical protein